MAVSTNEVTSKQCHAASIYASFNFTTTGTSEEIDCTERPISQFSIQATSSGSPTLWTAILEGSINGSNWDSMITNTNVIGLNIIQVTPIGPVRYFRVRVTSLTLLSAPSININVFGVR